MKSHAVCSLLLALLVGLTRPSPCTASLYVPPPPVMAYHQGAVLDGTVPVSVLYYGAFSPHHKAILADFLLSLSPRARPHAFGAPAAATSPSVARWWETVDRYVQRAGRERTRVLLTNQVSDEGCSLGKRLSRLQVEQLAARLGVAPGGVAVVLTAADVAVEGFCESSCGMHGSAAPGGARRGRARVGGQRGRAVPGPVRVAVPRRGRLPPCRARAPEERRHAPCAQRGRRSGWHGDQPGGAAGRRGDEPVRARVLRGRRGRAGGGGRRLSGRVRQRRVPRLPRHGEAGHDHGRRVQRGGQERQEVPRAGPGRSRQLLLPDHGLVDS